MSVLYMLVSIYEYNSQGLFYKVQSSINLKIWEMTRKS